MRIQDEWIKRYGTPNTNRWIVPLAAIEMRVGTPLTPSSSHLYPIYIWFHTPPYCIYICRIYSGTIWYLEATPRRVVLWVES
jgi:hypothetical protein